MNTSTRRLLRRAACIGGIAWLCRARLAFAQPDPETRLPQRPAPQSARSAAPAAPSQERQYRFFGTLEYHGAGQARFQCDAAVRWQCRRVSPEEVRYEVDFDSVPGNEADAVIGEDQAYHGCRPVRRLCLSRNALTQAGAAYSSSGPLWRADNREFVNGREINILARRDGALQQARSVPADADRRIHETIARWHHEYIAAAGLRTPPEYEALRGVYRDATCANYAVAGYAQLAQP